MPTGTINTSWFYNGETYQASEAIENVNIVTLTETIAVDTSISPDFEVSGDVKAIFVYCDVDGVEFGFTGPDVSFTLYADHPYAWTEHDPFGTPLDDDPITMVAITNHSLTEVANVAIRFITNNVD